MGIRETILKQIETQDKILRAIKASSTERNYNKKAPKYEYAKFILTDILIKNVR